MEVGEGVEGLSDWVGRGGRKEGGVGCGRREEVEEIEGGKDGLAMGEDGRKEGFIYMLPALFFKGNVTHNIIGVSEGRKSIQ